MTVHVSQMGASPPRLDLPQPIDATLLDLGATIVEVSLVGCSVRHEARVKVGSTVTLDFTWKKRRARLTGKVMRSTMEFVEGKAVYISGLQLAESIDKSPEVIRDIIATLVAERPVEAPAAPAPPPASPAPPPRVEAPPRVDPAPKPAPPPLVYDSVPFLRFDNEPEDVAPPLAPPPPPPEPLLFLECTLVDGKWRKVRVSSSKQPEGDGFTILAPADESEADELCRTYEVADPETRRAIRFSFELAIEQKSRV